MAIGTVVRHPAHQGFEEGVIVTVLRFGAWIHQQREIPLAPAVMARFGVSKATANRWLNAYEAAFGVERVRRPGRPTPRD